MVISEKNADYKSVISFHILQPFRIKLALPSPKHNALLMKQNTVGDILIF